MDKNEQKIRKTRIAIISSFYLTALFLLLTSCSPDLFFIPVNFIEDVPNKATVGEPLVLTGTVRPAFASNNSINWAVKNAGTTEAVINGNILICGAKGTILIRAIVTNGMAEGRDYTQDFKIVIEEGNSPEIPVTNYNVTFESNGGNTLLSQSVENGGHVTRPSDPVKAGFGFVDWYSEPSLTTIYNFSSPVTGNITLYAKWIANTYTLTLSVESIVEAAGTISPSPIPSISRSAGTTRIVSVTGTYESIKWEIDGVGAYLGQTVSGTDSTFTIDGSDVKYNTLGGHVLRLIVKKDGKNYQVNIPFTVVE